MQILRISVALVTLAVCGCAVADQPEGTLTPGGSSPMPTNGEQAPSPKTSAQIELTGVLGFDDIEGGCPFLAAEDGGVYQVVYPDGWQLDTRTGALRGPDDQQLVPGSRVRVRGSVADMLSTCQIGPIFVATEVLIPTD